VRTLKKAVWALRNRAIGLIIRNMTTTTKKTDRETVIALALGRIFRMGARPTQPGDVEEYERCRAIILKATEES
jgi:hypothetical protein